MLHLMAHAVGKIIMFFAVGAIQSVSGRSKVSELPGIARMMPWTIACFVVAAASLTGLPPLSGFVSKWFLLQGMVSPPHVFAITAIVLSTLLNFAYFGRVVATACSPAPAQQSPLQHGDAPRAMLFAMAVPAILVIVLPLFSKFVIDLLGEMQ